MATDTKLPVPLPVQVLRVGCIMHAVAGKTVQISPGTRIPDVFTLGVGNVVLMFVASITSNHRLFYHQKRMIGAVRLVTFVAVQTVAMGREPPLQPGGGSTRVVAGQAERLQRHVQQSAAVGSMGVVTGLAFTPATGNVWERRVPGPLDLLVVTFAAQQIQRETSAEWLVRAGKRVAGGAPT
jgi:hypothetical protein